MKKRFVLFLILVLVAACFAGCGNSGSGTQTSSAPPSSAQPSQSTATPAEPASDLPQITLNLGTMYYDPAASTEFNTDGTTTQYFVDLVSERSGGRITVNVHWASVLGGTTELFDQARSGDLDMVFGGAISSCDTRFGVFNVPGLMDDFDMSEALCANPEGGLHAIQREIYQDNNIELLGSSIGQFRGLFNNKREIHLPEDCKDLMLRAYADEVVTKYWNGLCNTTVMSISEVYTGLQLGTIDGLEFWPTAMIANGYTDVLDYYSDLYWQWQANSNIYMHKPLYDSLDSDAQTILRECAQDAAGSFYRKTEEANMEQAYTYMRENGIEIYELTADERAAWKAYADSLQEDFRQIVGAEVYDRAFAVAEEYRASK